MQKMTWTIKWETMTGRIMETQVKAATDTEAIQSLCRYNKVGNVLSVKDCYRVKWV